MAQVTIEVNGRPYTVGCEDGQEGHLLELARMFDRLVRQVSEDMGQLGETRLFLMAALLLADEMTDTRARMTGIQAEIARLQSDNARVEARAAAILDKAASRLERIAGD